MTPLRQFPAATLLAAIPLFGCHGGQPATPKATAILPLRTLHLYETGVGYFERSGEIGASTTTLPVPAGHLDDALKTLVILTPDGKVKVQGFSFGSSLSKGMARAQAGLPLEADAPITYRALLESLKGASVEVTTKGGTVRGRIVDVVDEDEKVEKTESAEKPDKPEKVEKIETKRLMVLLLSDKGELLRIDSASVTALRPTDPAFAVRLGSSLDALSTSNASTARPLELLGDPKGPVTFGYIAETPIWRASYRLVFAPDRKSAVLQGWALVHNDTDERWSGVRVSLVNGRPDSFLFPLAAPRYGRRTLVTPEHELSTVPQLMNKTPDAIWGDHLDDTGSSIGLGGIGSQGYGSGTGSGYGYGSGSGKIGKSVTVTTGSSSLLSVGDLAGVSTTEGVESGALFTYSLGEGLDLAPRHSALVPFLAHKLEVQAITWIDRDSVRAAARFVNATSQTLPAGTIAFFADAKDGAFVGESALDRLKPGERRFVEFGADLDVELQQTNTTTKEEVKKVRFVSGSLEEHFLRTTAANWSFENRSGAARDVYVVLHFDRNSKLTGPDKQDFDTATSRPVAVFHVNAKSKLDRPVTAVEGLSRRTAMSALKSARLFELAATSDLAKESRAALSEAANRQKELEETRAALDKVDQDIATTEKDIVRLRDHLKAAGEKGPAANPFVKRLLDAEDSLSALRKKREALDKESVTRRDAVKVALEKLT
ncbi:MAG: hypothetical protein HYV09_36910 [Deltaproteobacteria bacterium]|nr:hypothetical protein [Deltaproteobacteria bacterium]